jgi:hypothetical protein
MPLHKPEESYKSVVQFMNQETKEFEDIEVEKPYLILMQDADYQGDDDYHEGDFVSMRGRETAFTYLESNAFSCDIINSFVMTGHIHLGEEISIYSFMRSCIERKLVRTNLTVDDLDSFAEEMHPGINLDLIYSSEMNKSIKR